MALKFVTLPDLRLHAGLTVGDTSQDTVLTDFAEATEAEILNLIPRFKAITFNQALFVAAETHDHQPNDATPDDSLVLRHFPVASVAGITDINADAAISTGSYFLRHDEGMVTFFTNDKDVVLDPVSPYSISLRGNPGLARGKRKYVVSYTVAAMETPADIKGLVLRSSNSQFQSKGIPGGVRSIKVGDMEIENEPAGRRVAFFTPSEFNVILRYRDTYRHSTAL
jgi:hypothetical protein